MSASPGKMFKGLSIELLRKRPAKTHNLAELYKPLSRHVALEDALKDFLHMLSPYYFITRYPDIAMGLPGGFFSAFKGLYKEPC